MHESRPVEAARSVGVFAAAVVGVLAMGLAQVAVLEAAPRAGGEGGFSFPAGERQLFLDDVDVASAKNIKQTMHRPLKQGAVIRSDPNDPLGALQVRMSPLWIPEAKVFRFLVVDTGGPRSTFQWFTSPDGLHWSPGKQSNMGTYTVVYDRLEPDPPGATRPPTRRVDLPFRRTALPGSRAPSHACPVVTSPTSRWTRRRVCFS